MHVVIIPSLLVYIDGAVYPLLINLILSTLNNKLQTVQHIFVRNELR